MNMLHWIFRFEWVFVSSCVGRFHNAGVNIYVQGFFVDICFQFLGHIPKSRITGPHSTLHFNFLKPVFSSKQLHTPSWIPLNGCSFSKSPATFVFWVCLIIIIPAILAGLGYQLTVFLIYISLLAADIECLLCSYWLFLFLLCRNVRPNTFASLEVDNLSSYC